MPLFGFLFYFLFLLVSCYQVPFIYLFSCCAFGLRKHILIDAGCKVNKYGETKYEIVLFAGLDCSCFVLQFYSMCNSHCDL